MRAGPGTYITCPEGLDDSPLAVACRALNVQVCLLLCADSTVAPY